MGIIKKTIYTGVLTGLGVVGYLGASTTLARPLPRDDPLFSSKLYAQHNRHLNGSTQDMVVKRIPLRKIRPELLQDEGALTVEFCRGVWSGLGNALSLPRCLLIVSERRHVLHNMLRTDE